MSPRLLLNATRLSERCECRTIKADAVILKARLRGDKVLAVFEYKYVRKFSQRE